MKIINKTNQKIIADKVKIANNPISRTIGLLNKSVLNEGEGLLITPCNSIHSFGMRFKFDAIFIDKKNKVKHIIKAMPAWRVSPLIIFAHSVIELPAGTADLAEVKIGDILELLKY